MVSRQQAGDTSFVSRAVLRLAAEPRVEVAREVLATIERHIYQLWEAGWQPVDLDRIVARRLGQSEIRLVRWAIASQSATYEDLGRSAAPAWMGQLEQIEAGRTWSPGTTYLQQLEADGDWSEALAVAVRSTALLMSLPALPLLVEPPSRWRAGATVDPGSLPGSVLSKVRSLLAKAESTTFEAEADAFTAKAQEMMTRHRIDRALLEAEGRGSEATPIGRRLAVDDPYADAKSMLLARIADANGCHTVWCKELGFSTAFGCAEELDAVEELFTSLLVQATVALRQQGSKYDNYGRSRTTRFRRSFLVAFAVRIGHRLGETVAATVTAVGGDQGLALVPLLAERDAAATRAAEEAFPEMTSYSPSATDGEGWHAGTRFGDLAEIDGPDKLDGGGFEEAA